MVLFRIVASLTMPSCGMCYGTIQDQYLLGILKSGDGGMKEWLSDGTFIYLSGMSEKLWCISYNRGITF